MSGNPQHKGVAAHRRTFGHWALILGLIIVVALAALLRFYGLNELPPGLWFDEAWSAVAARDTATQGVFPPYFAASFGGMHPAIVYLTRFANLFTDRHPLTIRYALAVVGTLTVLLSFFSYWAIFDLKIKSARLEMDVDEQSSIFNHQSSILALLGAFILAITFPFLLFTRMGLESSLVAPASLMVFGCLALALRQSMARWYLLTGAMLGLSLYSFDTARFLPFAVSFAYWGVVLSHRRAEGFRYHLVNFVWLTLAALVIFMPLGSYFIQNWGQFTERAGITTYNTLGPGAESVPLALLNNAWRTLGGLSLPGFGDVIARHNLPGRPVFDESLSILFWLGVIVLIWQWQRPFATILISWASVMLLPVILTDGAPTYTRIFGAIPALVGIAALSLFIPDVIKRLIHQNSWVKRRLVTIIMYGALSLLLFSSLATTIYDYFVSWANEPALFDQFQVADWQAASLAKERSEMGVTYLVPDLIDEAQPTFALVLADSVIRVLPANCLAGQAEADSSITYLIKSSSAPNALTDLQTLYPEGQTETTIISPLTGETLFLAFSAQSIISNLQAPSAQFGNTIHMLGQPEMTVSATAVSLPLTWRAISQPTANHTYFIHLYRAGAEDEPPVAQLDQQPCLPTSHWHTDEVVIETAVLPLSPDLPPGDYTVGLGWYTWPSFERLLLTNSGDSLSAQRYLLGQITIGESVLKVK